LLLRAGRECVQIRTRPAQWCPEQHCRMITQRRCYFVPERNACRSRTRPARMVCPAHHAPDTQRRCTCARGEMRADSVHDCHMVPEQHCRDGAAEECIMVRNRVRADSVHQRAGSSRRSAARPLTQYRCKTIANRSACRFPITTCRMVPRDCVRLVPETNLSMEPYCVSYPRLSASPWRNQCRCDRLGAKKRESGARAFSRRFVYFVSRPLAAQ